MGIYTDLLANAKSWDAGGPDEMKIGVDRVITLQVERFLAQQNDVPYTTDYATADELQEIGTYNGSVTSGNFTLTVSLGLSGSVSFTTANIAWNANAATIESAIDTAASAVPGWTNGDISVAGGDLTSTAVTLTYDGASVNAVNHPAVQINDVDLGGGGTVGTVTTTTNGQPTRTAMAALNIMGVIDSPPPEQGVVTGITATSTRASNPHLPRQEVLQALALQAAIEESTDDLYAALMEAMGLERLL